MRLLYTEPVDVVLSSLFTHHLEEPEIVRFLEWSEAVAQRGWFVNDLCREATPYKLFRCCWRRRCVGIGLCSMMGRYRSAEVSARRIGSGCWRRLESPLRMCGWRDGRRDDCA